jgi:hypothetical protein
MKKPRFAKKFLEEFQKTPIVSAVCKSLNISRQTISRWCKEDPEFNRLFREAERIGVENINDLAQSKLISAIDRSEKWAVLSWLGAYKKEFMRPKPKDYIQQLFDTNKEQQENVAHEILRIAGLLDKFIPENDDKTHDPKTDTQDQENTLKKRKVDQIINHTEDSESD